MDVYNELTIGISLVSEESLNYKSHEKTGLDT